MASSLSDADLAAGARLMARLDAFAASPTSRVA